MSKILYLISYTGGMTIVILGLTILLIVNDTNDIPHSLVDFTLFLLFFVGGSLVIYIVKNRGIR